MKDRIIWLSSVLPLFIKRFGFTKGLKIFLEYRKKKATSFTLPGIAHPIHLRPGTSDFPTFHQVFISQEYNINLKESPEYIIDGGANVGFFAIYMKNRYPDAKIICIEPDPDNFKLLQQNMAPYEDVECIQYGIWNKDTRLKVYDKYNAGKWGMVVEEDLEQGMINSITIGTIMSRFNLPHIDILKLDIETSEKQVFSSNYTKWLTQTKTILIELHDWMEPGCAKIFFDALSHSFNQYSYNVSGENVIIHI